MSRLCQAGRTRKPVCWRCADAGASARRLNLTAHKIAPAIAVGCARRGAPLTAPHLPPSRDSAEALSLCGGDVAAPRAMHMMRRVLR